MIFVRSVFILIVALASPAMAQPGGSMLIDEHFSTPRYGEAGVEVVIKLVYHHNVTTPSHEEGRRFSFSAVDSVRDRRDHWTLGDYRPNGRGFPVASPAAGGPRREHRRLIRQIERPLPTPGNIQQWDFRYLETRYAYGLDEPYRDQWVSGSCARTAIEEAVCVYSEEKERRMTLQLDAYGVLRTLTHEVRGGHVRDREGNWAWQIGAGDDWFPQRRLRLVK